MKKKSFERLLLKWKCDFFFCRGIGKVNEKIQSDLLRRLETSMYRQVVYLVYYLSSLLYVFSSIPLTEKETIMCRVFLCLPTQVIGSIHQINEKYMSITCISISLTVDDSRNNLTKITAFRGLYSTKNKMIPRSVPI